MKKNLLLMTVFAMMAMFAACGHQNEPNPDEPIEGPGTGDQLPSVKVTVTDITTTTADATFTRNEACTDYYFLLDDGSMEEMSAMFGFTLEEGIEAFGVHYDTDSSFHWTQLATNSNQYIQVIACGGGKKILHTDTIRTLSQGGTGTSVVTVAVSEITDKAARMIATPNSETEFFVDGLIEKSYFDSVGFDGALEILKESPYPQYETDNWLWQDLTPETYYYACAVGANANNEWGPMDTLLFCTAAATTEVARLNRNNLVVNNTAAGSLEIHGLPATGAAVVLLNMRGQMVRSELKASNAVRFDVNSLPAGVYYVRVIANNAIATHRVVLK